VVAVILDSAVGLHQGGQVSAPVFHRVAQQALEYLHTPHDLPLAPNHQLLLASRAKDKDLEEGTPDHPGEPLETAEVNGDSPEPGAGKTAVARTAPTSADAEDANDGQVVQAAMRRNEPVTSAGGGLSGAQGSGQRSAPTSGETGAAAATRLPVGGTVVLDVEQGGIEVPSFVGKTVRGAVETAQEAGLELEAVGSGVARQQAPVAGTHVAAGAHVTVQFGR
jgi:cell division protein FtsI (penicillin-binding protein 3)